MNNKSLLISLKTNFVFVTSVVFLFLILPGCSNSLEIRNPYEQVNWEKWEQYKASFHTHTTRSDGIFSPQTVVGKYHKLGYSILAITDHNSITYPWTDFKSLEPSDKSVKRVEEGTIECQELMYENRNPEKLDMIAIPGNEISSPQHLGSYFSDHEQRSDTIEKVLDSTKKNNGILIFNHPGKYKNNAAWYSSYFQKYDHLKGIEIYNQGNRYPNDQQLWDSVLVNLMPVRQVWGFSNDDFHGTGCGRNWNVMMIQELSSEWVKKGMKEGLFFYVYAPSEHEGAEPPRVNSIHVNKRKALIKIESVGYDSIRWISAGKVISRGNIIQIQNDFRGNYVRAEIFGKDETIVGTQPFGVIKN